MPNQYTKNPVSLEDAFWSKVSKSDNCWLWIGGKYPNGYGHFRGRGAHRVSYELAYGPVDGLDVLHKCDIPSCVRPDHLFAGTQQDNYWDMVGKGRTNFARGERQHNAKLTPSDISEIRRRGSAGESQASIGKSFGVAQSTIGDILLGVSWKHVS